MGLGFGLGLKDLRRFQRVQGHGLWVLQYPFGGPRIRIIVVGDLFGGPHV